MAELVVRMLDTAGGEAIDALIATLTTNVSAALPRLPHLRGRVVVYDRDGDVLRIVEVGEPAARVDRR